MSDALHLASNMNMYITPPGLAHSLAPHNDFQCSFMTQLLGSKRWRLWHKPALHLPVRARVRPGRMDRPPSHAIQSPPRRTDVVLHPCARCPPHSLRPSLSDIGALY